MKLRVTILLLAGVLLVLCGASKPQPASENPKDARKIRYAQRKELVNEEIAASESSNPDASDTNAPLSLLPAGADAPQGENRPNAVPDAKGLKDGVTASASLDNDPADTGSETSSVRSLAIDGAPYGEARKVVKQPALQAPVKTPQVLATANPKVGAQTKPTMQTPPPIAGSGQLAKTAVAKQPAPKPVPSTPRDQKLLASAKQPKVADLASAKPALPKAKTIDLPTHKAAAAAPIAVKAKPSLPKDEELVDSAPAVDTDSTDVPQTEGEDHSRWLDKYLNKDAEGTDRSTDEVRSGAEPLADEDASVEATGGELIKSNPVVDDTELSPLGIPGRQQVATAPSRLRGWLFGLCGLFALGAIVVAVPKPRAVGKADDGLTLIETIGIGDGREIVILRKKHYALVLGKTRSATHLLEKVSMASLDSDYSSVINAIIKRESESPELWRMRPLFSGSYRTDYAPEERSAPSRRTSLAEMRAALQVVGPERLASTPAVRSSMGELRQRSEAPSVSARSRSVSGGTVSREVVMRRIREQARKAS
jgi:hypothetical protein